ncbi:MAG: tol-pal system protein YbgF [Devosia sp.]
MAFGFVLMAGVFAPEFVLAQSSQEAQLLARVQDLESTVRTLTGQVEGLQFQLTQMQQLIQKMQEDDEFRFQQLEGGAGKKSDAVTHSGGATPTGALPQTKSSAAETTTPKAADLAAPVPLKPSAEAGPVPKADVGGQPGDGLGDSQDPLLGKGASGESTATLGTLPADGSGLNLNLDSSASIETGDADAQYNAGYDAITRGDYAFAEDQFRQFISLYPKDTRAPDATNWLGDALLQRGAYDEAADALLTGFQTYEKSARAPDLLLKLGIALAGAGEQDTACRTFFEVAKRYSKQPAAFLQRLQQERSKAQCPA